MVHGCRYNVCFYVNDITANTASAMQIACGTLVGPEGIQSQITSTANDFMEYPSSKYKKMVRFTRSLNGATNAYTPMDSKRAVCKGYASTRQLWKDYRNITVNNPSNHWNYPSSYQASETVAPEAENYLVLYCRSLIGQSPTEGLQGCPQIIVAIKLVYYVEFFNPIYPAAS